MATYIISNWRVTFDPAGVPLILLDYGDRMVAEPEMGQTHGAEMVNLLRAAAPVARHRGNVGHSLSISRVVDHADIATARNSMLAHLAVTAGNRVASLKVEVQNGATYELANAVLSDVTPTMSPEHGAHASRVVWSYAIQGGGIS